MKTGVNGYRTGTQEIITLTGKPVQAFCEYVAEFDWQERRNLEIKGEISILDVRTVK